MLRFMAFTVAMLGLAFPAHAEWRKAVSPSFIVYGEVKPEALIDYTRKVERFDTFLRARFGLPSGAAAVKLTIFMVGSDVKVGQLVGVAGDAGDGLGGFFTIGPHGSIAIVKRVNAQGKFSGDSDTILFHEYTHYFMRQYFPAAYPAWFSEGFAEFYSTTDFDKDGRASYGMPANHRAYELLVLKKLPASQLLNADVQSLDKEARGSLYGRGWLLTHFFHFEPSRKGQLDNYLIAINNGVESGKAAKDAFGDPDTLDKDADAYLKRPKMTIGRQTEPTPVTSDIGVTSLDEAASATMLARIKVMQYREVEDRAVVAASIRKVAQANPGSLEVQTLLAQALYAAEDDAGALAAAGSALAIKVDHQPALLIKGKAEIRGLLRKDIVDSDRWKAARALLIKANRLDPEDPYPLYFYYLSFRNQGIAIPPLAVDGLTKAAGQLPGDHYVRNAYLDELVKAKKFAEAIRIYKPVAFDPHNPNPTEARLAITRLEKAAANGGKMVVETER